MLHSLVGIESELTRLIRPCGRVGHGLMTAAVWMRLPVVVSCVGPEGSLVVVRVSHKIGLAILLVHWLLVGVTVMVMMMRLVIGSVARHHEIGVIVTERA